MAETTRTPLQERILAIVRKEMDDPDFDETMKGWAVVTAPGGRWLGKVVAQYFIARQGKVWPTLVPTATIGGQWQELVRVDLQPCFVMASPEVITLRYDETHHAMNPLTRRVESKTEHNVGAGMGQGVWTPGNMRTYHAVRQIAVSGIERSEEWAEHYRMLKFGEIVECIGVLNPAASKEEA